MDLLDLTPKSDEIVVVIKHPATGDTHQNNDGTDMTITICAPHSKDYKKVLHEITNKRLKKMQSKGKNDVTAEELEEGSLEVLAKTTRAWNITYDGESPKLTVTKAKEVYERVFWIRSQIEGAIEDSLDFMKA